MRLASTLGLGLGLAYLGGAAWFRRTQGGYYDARGAYLGSRSSLPSAPPGATYRPPAAAASLLWPVAFLAPKK